MCFYNEPYSSSSISKFSSKMFYVISTFFFYQEATVAHFGYLASENNFCNTSNHKSSISIIDRINNITGSKTRKSKKNIRKIFKIQQVIWCLVKSNNPSNKHKLNYNRYKSENKTNAFEWPKNNIKNVLGLPTFRVKNVPKTSKIVPLIYSNSSPPQLK